METPKPESKLSSASEYALIFGAGASAAMSLAAQQVAAASVPVTALVAIGLMNRRRLDRQLQASESLGPLLAEKSAREAETPDPQVTAHPTAHSPVPQSAARPMLGSAPAMSPPGGMSGEPLMSAVPQLPFAPKQQRLMAAKQALQMAQSASLKQIGAQLQQVRVDRGFSLQDIHQQTYIQRYALQAIESGDLESLPEPFYIRAFLQKYAIALGLPGAEIAAQFPTA